MKKIFKYELKDGSNYIPVGAKVIHVNVSEEGAIAWVEFDSKFENELVQRNFKVFGTGWEIPDDAIYIKTWFQGPFVWHLYEVMR